MIVGVDPHPRGATDAGEERDTRPPKPCSRRVFVLGVHPAWCMEPDGHEGDCRGVLSSQPLSPPNYGPNRKDSK